MRQALALTCAVAFAVAGHATSIQHDLAVGHMDRAGQLLFADDGGNVQQGIASLLDAVIELTAGTDVPAAVRTSVQTARRELVSGEGPADDKVSGLLREAYKTLEGGKPFQQSRLEDMSELLELLRGRLASARSLAAAGNAGESARVLLAIALAIVTPMPQ